MRHAKTVVGLAAALLLAGGLAYATSPKFRMFTWVMAGRSPVCPLAQAMDIDHHLRSLKDAKDRILAASHLVKTENRLELWSTPKGEFWIPSNNRYVLPFNLAEMEMKIYGSGEHFIHPGDVVLDCGASDGDFTREALSTGAKLVVAIEISPDSIECIRRNLAKEITEGRVIVYPKGVWDQIGTLPLSVDDQNFAANSVVLQAPGARRTIEVPLTTIDAIVAELKLPRVDFIKMDIEGAEVNALHGAHDTLARFRPRLAIATEHKDDDETAIPAAIHAVKPDYADQCGYCAAANGKIRPEAMYFY